jgi:hypothetical protein
MTTPYFYIIKHKPTGKLYAGCKINHTANSSNLMTKTGYKTTSKVVKALILLDGLDSFDVLKVRHFENEEQALKYESKFLKKVNAAENSNFLNLHNGGKNFLNRGGYKLKESTRNKMKKPKSTETIQKQNNQKRIRGDEVYKKMVDSRRNNGMPWISDEQKVKIKNFNSEFWDEQNRELQSNRMIDFYKKNPIKQETKDKLKELNLGEKNKMFGKKHNEITREKMKLAWAKRKELKQQFLDKEISI